MMMMKKKKKKKAKRENIFQQWYSVTELMKKIAIIPSLLFLVMIAAATAAATTIAYGQVSVGPSSQDIEVIDSERVRGQVFQFIGATRLIDYTLFENGTAIYVFEYVGLPHFLQGNSTTNPVQSNILEIHTTHGFTPQNGYTFDATTGILTPEGKTLVIETFEPTNNTS
jgi:hypothetical protein